MTRLQKWVLSNVLLVVGCSAVEVPSPAPVPAPPVDPVRQWEEDEKEMVFVPGDAVLAIERRLRGVPRLKSAEDFFIDVHEVTVGMFRRFCEATGSTLPDQPRDSTDRHPVVNVTWREATDYAAWVGKRLPTALEWSAAALGGPRFPWGDDVPSRTRLHFPFWPEEEDWAPQPVGTQPEDVSHSGCRDMGANVREWVADERKRTGDPKSPASPREWRSVLGWSIHRVVANGPAYGSGAWIDSDRRDPSIGFRCAYTHSRDRPPRTP